MPLNMDGLYESTFDKFFAEGKQGGKWKTRLVHAYITEPLNSAPKVLRPIA